MMFQNLKINSHIVLVLCLFFFNCNKNNSCEFLNDNNQLLKNYDQLGIPFIAAKGRVIYQFEKT